MKKGHHCSLGKVLKRGRGSTQEKLLLCSDCATNLYVIIAPLVLFYECQYFIRPNVALSHATRALLLLVWLLVVPVSFSGLTGLAGCCRFVCVGFGRARNKHERFPISLHFK